MFTYSPKLTQQLILNTNKAMISLALVSLVYLYIYIDFIPSKWLLFWILLQIAFLIYRLYNAKQLQKCIDEEDTKKLEKQTKYYFFAVMSSSFIWTFATILSYIYAPPVYQIVSLLMIIGIVTASVLSIAYLLRIYIFYFSFLILPQFIIMLSSSSHVNHSIILLLLIFMPLIIALSRTMQNNYSTEIKTHEILQKHTDKLHKLSITDSLTKIYNRRYFFQTSKNLIHSAQRGNQELSILMIDIDFFKNINDTYGHQFGDTVLIALVDNINSMIRESDIFARIGGEEFILLLNHTPYNGAKIIAEKIRSGIEKTKFEYDSEDINLTISIGVSSLSTQKNNIEELYKDADANLYLAKESGRNKVY